MADPWGQQMAAMGAFIRSQRKLANLSLRQLAEMTSLSNPYLSQVERGLRKPSADVLAQIAKGLRVSAEVLYVRAGILEPGEASPVRDAVVTDAAITERQKQVLLDIYASFIFQNEAIREDLPVPDEQPAEAGLTDPRNQEVS